jgi:hypothetical protein
LSLDQGLTCASDAYTRQGRGVARKHSHPANRDWKESKYAADTRRFPASCLSARRLRGPGVTHERQCRLPVATGAEMVAQRHPSIVYLDEMALRVANLSDDIVLGDWPRLSTTWDELLAKMPRRTQGAYGIRMPLPQRRTTAGAAYICAPENRIRKPTLTVRPD